MSGNDEVDCAREIRAFLFDSRNRLASELSEARLGFVGDHPQYTELERFGEHTLEVWDDTASLVLAAIETPAATKAVVELLLNFVENSENWLSATNDNSFFLDISRGVHRGSGIDFRDDLLVSSWVDALGILIQTLFEYLASDSDKETDDGSQRYSFDCEAIALDPTLQLRTLAAINEFTTGEEFTAARYRAQAAGELENAPAGSKANEATAPKKSGEAAELLKSALIAHHKYDNGSVQNTNPVGARELAKLVSVSAASATAFFKAQFGTHNAYVTACSKPAELAGKLRLLNGEVRPRDLDGLDGNRVEDWHDLD